MDKLTFEVMELEQIREIRKEYAKPSGIYFLWSGDDLIYVGKSVNVHSRLDSHINGPSNNTNRVLMKSEITHVSIIPCSVDDLDVTEAIYINKFKPRCNLRK